MLSRDPFGTTEARVRARALADASIPESLVPVSWRDHELLKCAGRPYIPKEKIDGRWHADLLAYGCGQCLFCRGRKAAFLSTRLFIESQVHANSCFITLTYANEPEGRWLVQSHVVDFIKRLRIEISRSAKRPVPLRFFYVGEYGGRLGRPHYHLIVYGASETLLYGRDYFLHIVDACWGHGFVDVKEVHEKSFSYIAKYSTKGLTSIDDPVLKGRPPQFSAGSRNPGIGYEGFNLMAQSLLRTPSAFNDARQFGLVPPAIKLARKKMFYGGAGMNRLRAAMGVPDDVNETRKFLERCKARETMRSALFDYLRSGQVMSDVVDLAERMRLLIFDASAQPLLNREAKDRIHARQGSAYEPF